MLNVKGVKEETFGIPLKLCSIIELQMITTVDWNIEVD